MRTGRCKEVNGLVKMNKVAELQCLPGSQGDPTFSPLLPVLRTFQKVLHTGTYQVLMYLPGHIPWLWRGAGWREEEEGGGP